MTPFRSDVIVLTAPSFSVALECFQVISQGRGKVTKLRGDIQLPEFAHHVDA